MGVKYASMTYFHWFHILTYIGQWYPEAKCIQDHLWSERGFEMESEQQEIYDFIPNTTLFHLFNIFDLVGGHYWREDKLEVGYICRFQRGYWPNIFVIFVDDHNKRLHVNFRSLSQFFEPNAPCRKFIHTCCIAYFV